MNFDIEALESATRKTFDVVVGHREPKGKKEGEPVGFRVLGASSENYQKVDREIRLMNVRESASRRSMVDLDTPEGAELVVSNAEKRRDMVINACVVDWFGFTFGEKDAAPFSVENLGRLLRAKPNWRYLITAAIEDDANFTVG